ncbi:unnamed protein product [Durusdinium trenchii]|uniref:Uncharacterized protein n=1 Tax=Durusdinium trenchii TaxID=1381693 RepID=A0ABP0MV51_9DINO
MFRKMSPPRTEDRGRNFVQTVQRIWSCQTDSRQTSLNTPLLAKFGSFYKGTAPMLCGSVIFRSLPFVVYSGAFTILQPWAGCTILGVDGRVWASGAIAGLARALVENPWEALKTQKQVWGTAYLNALRSGCMWRGVSATCFRNVILVTIFFTLSERLNSSTTLIAFRELPFLRGSCVTVCCWVFAWPFDVVKSQLQSQVEQGNGKRGAIELLRRAWHEQTLYRGLGAGLLRACLANGAAMHACQTVQQIRCQQLPNR